MDGVRNFKSFAGTLAGIPVDLVGPSGTQAWVVFNDDAANAYTFTVGGQDVIVRAGEAIPLPFARDDATIDGTGDYRVLAVEDAAALPFIVRQDSTAVKVASALAGNGLTGGGGAALVVKPDVTTGGDTVAVKVVANGVGLDVTDLADGTTTQANGAGKLRIKDGGVSTAKLADGGVTAAKVGMAKNDGVTCAPDILVGKTLGDGTADTDAILSLPAGTTWAVVDAVIEQAGAGNAANSYTLQKGAAPIGVAILGSATDGKLLRLDAIPSANKAANSFANADTLRWAVVKTGGTTAAVAIVRLRRLT